MPAMGATGRWGGAGQARCYMIPRPSGSSVPKRPLVPVVFTSLEDHKTIVRKFFACVTLHVPRRAVLRDGRNPIHLVSKRHGVIHTLSMAREVGGSTARPVPFHSIGRDGASKKWARSRSRAPGSLGICSSARHPNAAQHHHSGSPRRWPDAESTQIVQQPHTRHVTVGELAGGCDAVATIPRPYCDV
jgi:hypothetical protein